MWILFLIGLGDQWIYLVRFSMKSQSNASLLILGHHHIMLIVLSISKTFAHHFFEKKSFV